MNQEVVIICESLYRGNTMRLARAMSVALNCRVVTAQEALRMDLQTYQVVGLGSGIYFTAHHPRLLEVAQRLNPTQQAFIFSTHGAPTKGRYHAALNEALRRNGVPLLGEFSSKGYDCTGPFILIGGGNPGRPNERDEKKSERFVEHILPQYAIDWADVPKDRFVRVNESCLACGKCVSVCPTHVFTLSANKAQPQREEDCIHCSLCLQVCPEGAIRIRHGVWDAIQIAKRHAKRRSLTM